MKSTRHNSHATGTSKLVVRASLRVSRSTHRLLGVTAQRQSVDLSTKSYGSQQRNSLNSIAISWDPLRSSRSFAHMPSNSALLTDAFSLLRCAYGAAKRERRGC